METPCMPSLPPMQHRFGCGPAFTVGIETMPRSGLPPAFGSFAEFEELVRHGTQAGLFDDYTFLAAELVDLARDTVRPAREALSELVARCRPAAERLGCAEELDEVARISGRGEGASEQRRIEAEAGSLLAVAQWLARTTVADLN
jgi:gamma-glutamyl:cysteine ligase YbdK (ATP-grasp superfamily)